MTLKISISGVRGIYGETLTEEVVKKFGIGFARFVGGGTVIVGSDTRKSGPQIKEWLFKGLRISPKLKIIDVGYLPTPTVQVLVKHFGADGGIIITASHNPKQWNGLKFVRPDGIFLTDEEASRLIDLYQSATAEDLQKIKEGRLDIQTDLDAGQIHIKKIAAYVNLNKVVKPKFKVVIDTCCGAGTLITPQLLQQLGIDYKQLNGEPNIEKCSRGLEPIAQNLEELGRIVKESGSDIGFAQDPDGDRLAIVNEKGEAIGEDYTLCLIADHVLTKRAAGKIAGENIICTNLSTTRIIDDVAKKHGAQVIRTKIGEMNVSMAMKRTKAAVGGEGNGGIMLPGIGFGRDSLAGISLMLEYLAETKKKVSELVAQFPKYVMYKSKIDCTSTEQVAEILARTKQKFANGQNQVDEQDGVKIVFPDGNWVHVRASNTEPIIRIITEAPTLEQAKQIAAQL